MSNRRFSDEDIEDIEGVFRKQAYAYGNLHTLTHSEQLLLTHFYETIAKQSEHDLKHLEK